jgi:hypothetical protein
MLNVDRCPNWNQFPDFIDFRVGESDASVCPVEMTLKWS